MYFGIAHLLGYPVSYKQPLYRFADFNAGWYASRNAAFQNAVSRASGIPLALDGDLVRYDSIMPGTTELAVRTLGKQLGMRNPTIRDQLEEGKNFEFEDTQLYAAGFRPGRKGGRSAIAACGVAGDRAAKPENHPQTHHGVVRQAGR